MRPINIWGSIYPLAVDCRPLKRAGTSRRREQQRFARSMGNSFCLSSRGTNVARNAFREMEHTGVTGEQSAGTRGGRGRARARRRQRKKKRVICRVPFSFVFTFAHCSCLCFCGRFSSLTFDSPLRAILAITGPFSD